MVRCIASTRSSAIAAVLSIACLIASSGVAAQNSQTGNREWSPTVANPAFEQDRGPVVLVDAAHGNFHTIEGRYATFAKLLGLDGYRVRSGKAKISREGLRPVDILVISNAIRGGDDAEWSLPVASAFAPAEIDVITEWVEDGGSLLLIADHMPFPGATAALADRFGVIFLNGYAMNAAHDSGTLTFTRASGSLAEHDITRGRSAAESISAVTSFTGQAFRFVGPLQPLFLMPDDWDVLLPAQAWEFDASTATVSARGLIQGGVLKFGSGRVAVFGEAAMFTAQNSVRDGVTRQMGLSHPSARENAQFVLNVMHWLSGLFTD